MMGNVTVGRMIQAVHDAEIAKAKIDLAYQSMPSELEANEDVNTALHFAKGTISQLQDLLENISL